MKVIIVGGVAGGASCAARARRISEAAEIIIFERGPHVSFANCGLPYYVGDVIKEEESLLVATPELFRERFNIWREALEDCPGVESYHPGGAFYFFPKIVLPGMDGHSFCMKIINEYGLAMVPGSVFGVGYDQHVRIAYGGSLEVQQGAARIFGEAMRELSEN